MNKDDIIRMARKAFGEQHELFWMHDTDDYLERFATLFAAAERERIASHWDALHEQYMKDPLRRQMMLSYELVANMIRGQA